MADAKLHNRIFKEFIIELTEPGTNYPIQKRRKGMAEDKITAVQNVIQQYINGTYHGDVEKLRRCFHENALMSGYLGDQMMISGPEPFFEDISKNPPMSEAGAPYNGEITSIEITGNTANVTVKETGFAGTLNFTNYFHLMKVEDEWKIMSKTFTTE